MSQSSGKSSCCGSQVYNSESSEGTSYYICLKCHKACDLATSGKSPACEHDEKEDWVKRDHEGEVLVYRPKSDYPVCPICAKPEEAKPDAYFKDNGSFKYNGSPKVKLEVTGGPVEAKDCEHGYRSDHCQLCRIEREKAEEAKEIYGYCGNLGCDPPHIHAYNCNGSKPEPEKSVEDSPYRIARKVFIESIQKHGCVWESSEQEHAENIIAEAIARERSEKEELREDIESCKAFHNDYAASSEREIAALQEQVKGLENEIDDVDRALGNAEIHDSERDRYGKICKVMSEGRKLYLKVSELQSKLEKLKDA